MIYTYFLLLLQIFLVSCNTDISDHNVLHHYNINNIDTLNFTTVHRGFNGIYIYPDKNVSFEYCKISVDGIQVYETYDVNCCYFFDNIDIYTCDNNQTVCVDAILSTKNNVIVWIFKKDPNKLFNKVICILSIVLFLFGCLLACCIKTEPTKIKKK